MMLPFWSEWLNSIPDVERTQVAQYYKGSTTIIRFCLGMFEPD